jgi:hypothetical protein
MGLKKLRGTALDTINLLKYISLLLVSPAGFDPLNGLNRTTSSSFLRKP